MSSNERPLQKPPTRGTARKSSNPMSVSANQRQNQSQSQNIRDTQYPDDDYLLGEDDPYASNPPRPHSSAIRLNPGQATRRSSRDVQTDTQVNRRVSPAIPPRSTQKQSPGQATGAIPSRQTRNVPAIYEVPRPVSVRRERRNIHWLFYVGLGMLGALALWALGTVALNWGTSAYNTIVYGYPRTFQTDEVVGHNDSTVNPSHFIAVNLHGQIIVVEFPGGDPSRAIDYVGPDLVGSGEDQLPVTLSFSDLNHDGKVDMIIRVSDRDFVFYNNGTKFVPSGQTPSSASPTPTPAR